MGTARREPATPCMHMRIPGRLFPPPEKGIILNNSFNRPPMENRDNRDYKKSKALQNKIIGLSTTTTGDACCCTDTGQ